MGLNFFENRWVSRGFFFFFVENLACHTLNTRLEILLSPRLLSFCVEN
jgi:hypothetical protein